MSNLVELFDNVVEFQNYNGVPLAAGKLYVFALGRTRLMDTWSDIDGESLNPNPIILDDLGQCHCYVSDAFDYTIVVCDQFDNEIFSVDKYLLSKGEHSHADVAVAPSEHIGVSSYHVGEVTVYVPYLTGEVGKTYEGISPIVVNNELNRISANHIPLGVQDPLYFVEDSETACIIGCSAQTEIPTELSGKWDEASDAVIANSAQWAEGTEYEAGNYVSIDGHTINVTGLQPEGDYAYNSALSSKLDVTALPQDLVHSGDLTAYYPASNPSGFITGVDLSDYATNEDLQTVSADITAMIPTALTGDYLTKESADTLYQPIGQYQSALDFGYVGSEISSINGSGIYSQGGTANPQIPVTSTSGISIFESADKVYFNISADYAFNSDLQSVSAEITGMIPAPFDPTYLSGQIDTKLDSAIYAADSGNFLTALPSDLVYTADIQDMATTGQVAKKLDTTAFSTVSGNFLTAHQDLSNYQTTAGMTAYQSAGDYYSASNPSGFITGVDLTPYQLTADMTAYQPTGDYLTTADSANFYTTANESGFLTAVPETYLQNTDLEISDNKITGISGIPLSAGGDVPEGVMVESGLEYNANNKISGYNGSAFAGDEQVQSDWTVTAVDSPAYILNKPTEKNLVAGTNVTILESGDDVTIETTEIASGLQLVAGPGVTLTVSGSNVIAGIDETVLWEGASNSACTLSENPLNFEYLEIYASEQAETAAQVTKLYFTGQPSRVHFNYNAGNNNSQFVMAKGTITTNSFNVTNTVCFELPFTGSTTAITINRNQSNHMNAIKKIVGINHISS